MPIPFIVWGIVVGGAAVVGVTKVVTALRRIKKVRNKFQKQQERYEKFIIDFEDKREHVNGKINDLGKLKLKAAKLLGEVVIFLRNAKLKERDLQEKFNIDFDILDKWEKVSINASDVLKGIVGATLSGVSTASGVYGLIGTLASASTGNAISSLSGIAAKNATLAWLGGGTLASGGGGVAAGTVVLGGLVVGPAFLVTGFVLDKSAKKAEIQAEKEISKIQKDIADKKKVMVLLDKVSDRVAELKTNTKDLMKRLKETLAKADPSNIEETYAVTKIAKSLAELLESKVIDEQGNIC